MLAEAVIDRPNALDDISDSRSVHRDLSPQECEDRMSEVLRTHLDFLKKLAKRVCTSLSLAEADDIVQQTCMQAWRKRHSFDFDRPAKPWLARVLKNEYYQTLRRGSYAVSAESEQLPRSLADPFDPNSTVDAIAMTQALSTLSQDQREAVVLVLVYGFTYEEAAGFVDSATGTLKSRVARGRGNLAALLDYR